MHGDLKKRKNKKSFKIRGDLKYIVTRDEREEKDEKIAATTMNLLGLA